jgi:hypothetical protein
VEQLVGVARTVSYNGATFSADPSLASEVSAEKANEVLDGKPCDIVPTHPLFRLVGYPTRQGEFRRSAEVRVFSIAKFRAAVAAASNIDARNVIRPLPPPDWVTYFDKELRTLKALLKKKPRSEKVATLIAKERGDPNNTQMPFLPM